MCGIVGYIGKNNPKEILLAGLKNLEYRGYDSAGIALKNEENVQIIKSIGKISALEEKINDIELINANMGIAHTRWATHGKVTLENAHPHQAGYITVVHNGIIENANELKENLVKEGISFYSDTDTEVIAAIINKFYCESKNIFKAISKALNILKGSYALGILVSDIDKVYAVRKNSPLIVGVGKDEYFIASDIAAIINYTNRYILLDEDEICELSFKGVEVSKDGMIVEKDVLTTDLISEDTSKGKYEHFMLKEIMEEPNVFTKTLEKYLNNPDLLIDLNKYEEIHIVACGSAMYAGMVGKYLLEEVADIKVDVECASEYRYKKVFYNKKTLVILISQSGETADTIAAMRKAKENGIDTLAIVNVKTSTIAREALYKLFIEAGAEIAVATTKAYLLQVLVLSLLTIKTAYKKNLINLDVLDEVKKLPIMLDEVLKRSADYQKIADAIYENEDIFFIGRGIDYAISMEGSLKLKEVAYIHSEAYQAGELKHGTISLIEDNMPVFAIITDEKIKDKTLSNVIEVKSRGAKVIVITSEDDLEKFDYEIIVPKVNKLFQSMLIVPVLQLIAYYTALKRNCEIDKPKNLAKSVTVE